MDFYIFIYFIFYGGIILIVYMSLFFIYILALLGSGSYTEGFGHD